MLRLTEKRAKGFAILLVISPAGIDCVTRNFSCRLLVSCSEATQFDRKYAWYFMIDTYKSWNVNRIRNVTSNFACLLLVSRTSQENVFLVIQILTCEWVRRRVFISLLSLKLCHKNAFCLHYMVNNVLMFVEWDKKQISGLYIVCQPAIVKCAHITIFGVSPGLRCHKTHWKVVFLVLIRWFNDIIFLSYFKIGEYIGILFIKIVCKQPKMAQLHCHQQKSLTYHFEINRLSLKISGNNIVYRNPWY